MCGKTKENIAAPATAVNLHGDAIAGVTSHWPVNVPATATVAHSVYVDGKLAYDREWDVAVVGGELRVTPLADAKDGEYAHIMFLDGSLPVGEAKITAIAPADNDDDGDNDDTVTPPFATTGGIEPGATEAFATNSTTTPGSDTLSVAVFDQHGTPKSDAGWSAEFGSVFADNDISVTAPQTVVKGDYAVVTVTDTEGRILGTVRATVQSDGEHRLRYDVSGDILPGDTFRTPVDVPADATLHFSIHRDGITVGTEGWDVRIVDGELIITAPENALPGDLIHAASLHNLRLIGQAKLNVIAPAEEEEDQREFEIRGDILAGATDSYDHMNTDGLVVGDITVVDATGTAKSTEGWSVVVDEATGAILVTAPEDAANGDVVAALFTRDGSVVGDLALRAVERADNLLFDIVGDILPGITSTWPVPAEAVDADLAFEVFDRDGNEKSAEGWTVEFDENGEFTVTAPGNAREGDHVKVIATRDGEKVGGTHLKVAVDGNVGDDVDEDVNGSSTPWWTALIPILGIAGVIALLTGGSSLSSGSSLPSGSSGSSDASSDDNGGGAVTGDDNQGGGGQGPATGPVDGEDPKAAAQAQAANAPAYTPAAHNPGTAAQQPATAQQQQGTLANTGVQNTMIALVAGLLAAAAGVFLLTARRRNG